MKWTPKPYQIEALKFIYQNCNAGVFLDPGMGKTSTALALLTAIKTRTLVVVPIRPMYKVWPDEVKKWDEFKHLKVVILHGPRKELALNDTADIYLINPEGLKWFMQSGGMLKLQPENLIVDESTKFKDSSTSRFKLFKPWLPKFKRRLILTGEPAPNGYMDLFGQMYVCDVGKTLGRFITHYRSRFFYQTGYGGYTYTLREGAAKEIQDAIRPSVMRLAAEDHLDMPELVINDIKVDLDAASMKIYKDFEDELIAEVGDKAILSLNAAAAGMKCRQVANGGVFDENSVAHHIHDFKTDALADLVEQLQGNPLLVFYEFKHDLDRIKRAFPSAPCLTGLTGAKLDKCVDAFNKGEIPILLAHPASAGHGLNLQGSCHHVCFYGLTWDLDLYHQGYKRVWRQGQGANRVFVHRILADKTLDKTVAETLYDKAATQKSLMDAIRSLR